MQFAFERLLSLHGARMQQLEENVMELQNHAGPHMDYPKANDAGNGTEETLPVPHEYIMQRLRAELKEEVQKHHNELKTSELKSLVDVMQEVCKLRDHMELLANKAEASVECAEEMGQKVSSLEQQQSWQCSELSALRKSMDVTASECQEGLARATSLRALLQEQQERKRALNEISSVMPRIRALEEALGSTCRFNGTVAVTDVTTPHGSEGAATPRFASSSGFDSPHDGRDFDEVTLAGEEVRQECHGSAEQNAGQAMESQLCTFADLGGGLEPDGLLQQLPDSLECQFSPEATITALQQMRRVLAATVTHMASVSQDAASAREEHDRLSNRIDDLTVTIMRTESSRVQAEGFRAEAESNAAVREVRIATAEEHFAKHISHVRDLLVECGDQVLAMKADLENLTPRVMNLECWQASLQKTTPQAVTRFKSTGRHCTEEVLVQSLETMAHSGAVSSTSTMLNEDDLEWFPAGSSEVPGRAERGMQFRPRRSSSSCSRSCSRSASPGSQCGSSGPLPRNPAYERKVNSSRSPHPRDGIPSSSLAAPGESGTLQPHAEHVQPRELVLERAGSPSMTLDGKSTIKLALLQAELLGQAELRSQNCLCKVVHERQQLHRQQQQEEQQHQPQRHVSPAPPCLPLHPPQSLHTPQTPRMTASKPYKSTKTPPIGMKPSQQMQQPLQRQMSGGGRHNRQHQGQSPRTRPPVPTSPVLSTRR